MFLKVNKRKNLLFGLIILNKKLTIELLIKTIHISLFYIKKLLIKNKSEIYLSMISIIIFNINNSDYLEIRLKFLFRPDLVLIQLLSELVCHQ